MKASLLLAFLLPGAAACQVWQPVTAPPGDWVPALSSESSYATKRRSIVSDGTYLYAIGGADGSAGVYRSTDGTTWEPLNTVKGTSAYTMTTVAQRFIAYAGGKVWVGTEPTAATDALGYAPLHRLEPGETEWTPSAASGIEGPLPRGLFSLTQDSATGTYYLGSSSNYVFSSVDGSNWLRHTIPTTGAVASLYAKNGVVLAGIEKTNTALTDLNIWRSVDGGGDWTNLDITGGDRFIEQAQGILLQRSAKVYSSHDLGATWSPAGGSNIDLLSGNAQHVFSDNGRHTNTNLISEVYSSSGGTTWGTLPDDGFPSGFAPYDFVPHGQWLFAFGPRNNSGRTLMRIPTAELQLAPVLPITDKLDWNKGFSGIPLTLTVAAAGAEPKTYRWEKDGGLLPGFTGPMLQIPSTRASDTGEYRVTVTDSTGAVGESSTDVYVYDVVEGGLDIRYEIAFNSMAWDSMGASGGEIFARPDGSLLAFGYFNTLNFVSPEGIVQQTLSLSPSLSGVTNLLDSQQRMVREGEFGTGPAAERHQLRRYMADTFAPDPSFTPVIFNSHVLDIAELPGTGYVAIGSFTEAGPLGSTRVPVNKVALIHYDGSVDNAFNANLGTTASNLEQVEVAGSNLWIRGSFNSWNGTPANGAVRLDGSGALAAAYLQPAGPSQRLGWMKGLPSGRLLVKPQFSSFGLKVLRPDGSFDPDFNAGNGSINTPLLHTAVEQPDGRIVVSFEGRSAYGRTAEGYFRIKANGDFDPTFYCAKGSFSGPRHMAYANGFLFFNHSGIFQGTGSNYTPIRIFANLPGGSVLPSARWQASYELPSGQDGWEADPDQDGLSNFEEYAFGGNPLVKDSAERMHLPQSAGLYVSGEDRYPGIQFHRNKEATDVDFKVLASPDLGFAVDFGSRRLGLPFDSGNLWGYSYYSLKTIAEEPRQFLRVLPEFTEEEE